MATIIATKAKAALGSLLAGSILMAAVPANAQYARGHERRGDGISAGEVIAGAVVIGGLAAILSSGNNNRDRYDDRYGRNDDGRWDRDGRGYDYGRYGGSRQAVSQCVSAVESEGRRRADVDVTQVSGIERMRDGYRVTGRVAVDYRGRRDRDGWNNGRYDAWRDDGRDNDRTGYDRHDRNGPSGYQNYDDRGGFTCVVRYGRVEDVRLRGI